MLQRAERVCPKALRQEVVSGSEAGESGTRGTWRTEAWQGVQGGVQALGNDVAWILIAIKIPLEVFNSHIDLHSSCSVKAYCYRY